MQYRAHAVRSARRAQAPIALTSEEFSRWARIACVFSQTPLERLKESHLHREIRTFIARYSSSSISIIDQCCKLVIGKCLLVVDAHVDTRQCPVRNLNRNLEHVAQVRRSAP